MGDPRGKVVLITGGSRGLGKHLAMRFAREGARVVLWARTGSDLESAVGECTAGGGDACAYRVDVTDFDRVMEAAAQVKKEVGPVDVLVNNAGVVYGGPFLDVGAEDHRRLMDVNVNAHMWTMKAFMPGMVERNDGHVINVSSAAGLAYMPLMASYCASKAAVIMLTDSLRLEMKHLGKSGVRFTIVCPSFVRTGMFEGVKTPPWVKWLEPEELADKVYRGYRRGAYLIAEPVFPKLAPLIRALTNRRALDLFQSASGLNSSMDEWVGHNR